MKEQTYGAAVRPLQIVQEKNQRMPVGQGSKHAHVLLKQVALLQIGLTRPSLPGPFLQALQPINTLWGSDGGAQDEGLARQDGADQRATACDHGLGCQSLRFPQAPRVLAANQ